ncbi:hypothetical protein PInf_015623 [Phytophthora infestans]|nr:hypothetical protein PInf_015623 [Phytophthora infestans]
MSLFIPEEKKNQDKADLSVLISSIELACKIIASLVRRTDVTGLYGLDGSENAKGDQVKKPDVLANKVFVNAQKPQIHSRNEGSWDRASKAFVNECKNKPFSYSAR